MTEQKSEPIKALALKVDEHGVIASDTIEALFEKAKVLMKTGFAPKSYKTPQEVVGALMHVRQLGLPDTAISKVYVVHGSPAAWGDLPLALAKRSPDFGEFVEFFTDKDGVRICSENKNIGAEVFASVCRIKRKGCEEWSEHFFTREMAKKAGLIKNTWLSYFEDLIRYKSRGRGLKGNYADALHGLEQAEDLINDFETKSFEKNATQLDDLRQIGANADTKKEESHQSEAIGSDSPEELHNLPISDHRATPPDQP